MNRAGTALSQWGDALSAHQQRARELEEAAKRAVAEAEQASEAARSASSTARYNGEPDAQAQLDNALASANSRAEVARGDVEDIRRQAEQLLQTWNDDAAACARVLRESGEIAPDEGVFEMLGEAIASSLDEIADIAGIISAIAGVLSFVPGLNFIAAPVALISGAVALGAHATSFTIHGKWDEPMSYVTLAGDALGVIPGAGAALKGTSEAVEVTTSAAQAGFRMLGDDAAQGAVSLTRSGNIAEDGVQGAMNRLGGTMSGVDQSVTRKVVESSVDISIQAPTAADWATDSKSVDVAKDVASTEPFSVSEDCVV